MVDETMKKKIIFGLAIFALMFFFGGVYIVTTMETTIFDLHRLSQLHRTVAQRKELLQLIKKNQNNLTLRGMDFTREDAPGETAWWQPLSDAAPVTIHPPPLKH